MRGKVNTKSKYGHAPGITPAHAGKSKKPIFDVDTTGDHPRTCGEKEDLT